MISICMNDRQHVITNVWAGASVCHLYFYYYLLGLHDLEKLTLRYFVFLQYTVRTESIQTPLNFSLFVILQPFAKII